MEFIVGVLLYDSDSKFFLFFTFYFSFQNCLLLFRTTIFLFFYLLSYSLCLLEPAIHRLCHHLLVRLFSVCAVVPIFQEYEETCLFTIARFSASESLRVYPNIYKNSPPFASRKGFPLVGFAMSAWERESASDSIILSLLA